MLQLPWPGQVDPRIKINTSGPFSQYQNPPLAPSPQYEPIKLGGQSPSSNISPQAQIRETIKLGSPAEGGGGEGGIGGPSPDTSGLGIGDVTGGVTGNLGSIGSGLGLVSGVRGLGLIGALAQTSAETAGYQNSLSNIGFKNDPMSALASNMTGGAFGKSTHSQASRAVGDHSKSNNEAGDTNSFGGKVAGRMSDTAQSQGRGGASPNAPGKGVNSGAPGMRGTDEGFGTGTGSDGASSKVICTELKAQNLLDSKLYGRSYYWSSIHMSPRQIRAYHIWGTPTVRLMKKSKLISKIFQSLVQARLQYLFESPSLYGFLAHQGFLFLNWLSAFRLK